MSYESVKKPAHYASKTGVQAIEVIQDFDLNFCLGNVFKYIARAGKKPNEDRMKDLLKAREYLDLELKSLSDNTAPQGFTAPPVPAPPVPAPQGFTAFKSDLRGLAAYTSAAPIAASSAAPLPPEVEVYDEVAERLHEVLTEFDPYDQPRELVAEACDLMVQLLLLLSQRKKGG